MNMDREILCCLLHKATRFQSVVRLLPKHDTALTVPLYHELCICYICISEQKMPPPVSFPTWLLPVT